MAKIGFDTSFKESFVVYCSKSTLINLKYIFLFILLSFSTLLASAAKWQVYEVEDFYFYYQNNRIDEIKWMEEEFKKELFKLQNELNYHLNDKVDIFLIDHSITKLPYEDQWQIDPEVTGAMQTVPYRISINVEQSPISLIESFRGQASVIILYEMMYGATIQDQIRSANIYYLPNWVMQGLETYIKGGWTPELDNQWRLVYEQYGVKNFNLIPQRYDAIKGAAFLNFLHDEYGSSSIPTVLYMSRVSRKFNSALFYAFQKTNKELFEEWRDFYNSAYSNDLRKRLPINGIIHPQHMIIDFSIIGPRHYYALEKNNTQIQLKEYSEKGSKVLYQLGETEKALDPYIGSIQLINNELLLFTQTTRGLRYRNLNTGEAKDLAIPTANKIFKQAEQIFILNSSLLSSQLLSLNEGNLLLERTFSSYIHDLVIFKDRFVVYEQDNTRSGMLYALNGSDTNILFLTNYQIKQMIARGKYIYFNSNANGVYNGARYSIEDQKIEYLTDYRTDIAFHQWSDSVFAEYILGLDRSALLITEFINTDEVFVYDSLTPMFFQTFIPEPKPVIVDESYEPSLDSLPNYVFQTPVPESHDFTSSNYDSLMRIAELEREESAHVGEPEEFFKPRSFYIQLYNGLGDQTDLPFQTDLPQYMPSKLGLRVGGSLINQFEDRQLFFNYFSLRTLEDHDITAGYMNKRSKLPYLITYLHRQRVNIVNSTADAVLFNRNRIDQISLSSNIYERASFSINAQLSYRYDVQVPLSTSMETLLKEGDNKSQLASALELKWNRTLDKVGKQWNWNAAVTISPYLQLNTQKMSSKNVLSAQLSKKIGETLQFRSRGQAGFSLGANPYYFVLGGTSTDLLANYEYRNFSGFKEAAYYEMIYGIRGFNTNYRNGTSFGFVNTEIAFQPLKHFIRKPLIAEIFSQLEVIAFADLATSMYSSSIYDEANALNTKTINTPGGSFTLEVQNIKNPLIGSIGTGIHTNLFNYYVNADLAFGIESATFRRPMLHLSIGRVIL